MALANRVNVNFCPLLNTFYCKCMMNITRFKSQHNLQTKLKTSSDNQEPKNQTFEQMITHRQSQAHKSIIVKVNTFEAICQVENFCARYGTILNIFPYSTFSGQRFVLIEFGSNETVLELRQDAHGYIEETDAVRTTSPLFMYNHRKIDEQSQTFSLNSVASAAQFIIPVIPRIINDLKPLKSVSEQMIRLYNMLKIAELDIRLRFYTAEELSYYFSRLFVNLYVVPFGSSVNGFGQTGCDLDLLCRTHTNSNNQAKRKRFIHFAQTVHYNDRAKQKQFLEIMHLLMTTCIPGISNMKKILEARVPILKFTNLNTNMQCDLSSTNAIASYMSELLYIYGVLDCRVRPLVCTIRKWAQINCITKEVPGHWITNFSLTLLVIFYLQTKTILPPITRLKSEKDEKDETNNSKKPWFRKWVTYNNDSLDKLLYGFFEYYSTFDFKMQAICVREAVVKEKRDNSPIFIYNPFEPSLNVSKNVNLLELARIIHQFQNALYILVTGSEQDGILKLFEQSNNRTESKVDKEQHSITNNIESQEQSNSDDEKLLRKTSSKGSEKVKEIIT